MAFNWKQFAAGFMEKAVSDFESEKAERKELFKLDYMDKLSTAREERNNRRKEKKDLTDAGNRLISLGLDPSAAGAVLRQEGAAGAQALYDLTSRAMAAGAKIDPEAFVSGAYDANMTITDAIDQVMGELVPAEPGAKPAAMQEESFFGKLFNIESVDEKTAQYYAKTFGEDYETISAEARGEYKRGPVIEGGVKIDYSMLKPEDPDAELNRKVKQAQLNQIEAEIKEMQTGKKKALTPSQLNSAGKTITEAVSKSMNVELSWSEEGGYVLAPDQTQKALTAQLQAMRLLPILQQQTMQNGYANALPYVLDMAVGSAPASGDAGGGDKGDKGDKNTGDAGAKVVTPPPEDVSTFIEQTAPVFDGLNEADKKGKAVGILGTLRRTYGITDRDEAIAMLPDNIAKYLR